MQSPAAAPLKPPPIIIGVEGIAPKPIELTPAAVPVIDWRKVGALPPFQMFVHELAPCPPGRDTQEWAIDYALRFAGQRGDDVLMGDYSTWHTAKGYWPNETPLGVLKE
ncbi:hypothetical protein [uncultured Variovorax sp.]|uniref:hypothetical protein n=1 Tax=uncultured Variovorax sp. TaxID=114708 RepID=UPI0025F4F253|nr:hypothetical protein [uncultured Variovorax sp.]